MMFAGNLKWRRSVFDTTGAPWQSVRIPALSNDESVCQYLLTLFLIKIVDALLSNTSERSQTVTLVFEREVAEEDNADIEVADAKV